MTMIDLPADLDAAIDLVASDRGVTREQAAETIMREWMGTYGFLTERDGDIGSPSAEPGKPDPEYVQYPGYFKGTGSL